MGKGYREDGKVYLNTYICDGCRKTINIATEEFFCVKCINNRNDYIKKLELEIIKLKKEVKNV